MVLRCLYLFVLFGSKIDGKMSLRLTQFKVRLTSFTPLQLSVNSYQLINPLKATYNNNHLLYFIVKK